LAEGEPACGGASEGAGEAVGGAEGLAVSQEDFVLKRYLCQLCSLMSRRSIKEKTPPIVRQVKMSRRPSRVRAMPTTTAQIRPAIENKMMTAHTATSERVARDMDMAVVFRASKFVGVRLAQATLLQP